MEQRSPRTPQAGIEKVKKAAALRQAAADRQAENKRRWLPTPLMDAYRQQREDERAAQEVQCCKACFSSQQGNRASTATCVCVCVCVVTGLIAPHDHVVLPGMPAAGATRSSAAAGRPADDGGGDAAAARAGGG
jgi:hypothetical protein